MTEITIIEDGETAGSIDTESGSAEYSGDNPILARLIEEVESRIYTTTHNTGIRGEGVGDEGWMLPPDVSVPVTGERLSEHIQNVVEAVGGTVEVGK